MLEGYSARTYKVPKLGQEMNWLRSCFNRISLLVLSIGENSLTCEGLDLSSVAGGHADRLSDRVRDQRAAEHL